MTMLEWTMRKLEVLLMTPSMAEPVVKESIERFP